MPHTTSKAWERAEMAFNKPKDAATDAILSDMDRERAERAERTRALREQRLAMQTKPKPPARGRS
ncbi:MAG: hypothetical protein K9H25_23820 [Rhodospirillum sp.]|nr:hypothetical protein [Rhodospirillum sp.]MCF8489513.1 hypothetical protein [Rhodospirillum sp.]MCF8500568.1 hypothetical protein [Rhodospirillum sp.]